MTIAELEAKLEAAHERWVDEDTADAWRARCAAYEELQVAVSAAAQERPVREVRSAPARIDDRRVRMWGR